MIRIVIPPPLRTLAGIPAEVELEVPPPVTLGAILDALETAHPKLLGTIRDRQTKKRRPFMRFFACGEDLSHDPPETPVPEAVASGTEPFLIVGAIAGG